MRALPPLRSPVQVHARCLFIQLRLGYLLPQVYTISEGGDCDGSGALHMLHGCHATELLYAGEPTKQGITGLWSLPAAPSQAPAALVVVSFAAGSRALTAGERHAEHAWLRPRLPQGASCNVQMTIDWMAHQCLLGALQAACCRM